MPTTVYFSEKKEALMPCEELLEIENSKRQLHIGVPAESDVCEYRVAITPETVARLVRSGHIVTIEKQAGAGATFTDLQYSNAGAYVLERSEVYRADIIFKVNPPTIEEIDLMKERQIIFSYLPIYRLSETYFKKLANKRITAIALEYIRDAAGGYPFVKTLGEIAGTVAIQVASEYLSKSSGGKGILLGGISGAPPAEIVVVGTGTSAEFAIRCAMGIGAFVRVFDNSVQNLQRIQEKLNTRLYTSVLHPQALTNADAVIGAAYIDGYRHKSVIDEDMVMKMKTGAVIVDLSINRGGCCETSELRSLAEPTIVKHGVIHYCVPNITARVPNTASTVISNMLENTIHSMEQHGNVAIWFKTDPDIRNGVYMYNGILASSYIGNMYSIPYQDIHLIVVAF